MIANNEQICTRIVKLFKKAADQGYARGQCNLGLMYESGRGVDQDYEQAVMWYVKAADQGHARGQFNLGGMYRQGRGVTQDDAEAVKWFQKAAEQGIAGAQFNLGCMYDRGCGFTQNDAEAVKWYRKAAEQEHQDAFVKLKALADKADKGGNAHAQFNLGVMYAQGRGVTQDDVEADEWYKKAVKKAIIDRDNCLTLLMLQHCPAVLHKHSNHMLQHCPAVLHKHSNHKHFHGLNPAIIKQVIDNPSLYHLIRFMTPKDYGNFIIVFLKRNVSGALAPAADSASRLFGLNFIPESSSAPPQDQCATEQNGRQAKKLRLV